ncbi:PsbP domain-containing protein 2 [Hirschfeldia incana]|nr:PsbP domain-containing protein 2 [Hirschfeldia incana]
MWSSRFLASLSSSHNFSPPPKLSLLSSFSSSHQKIQTFICFTQTPSSTVGISFSKRHLNLSILTLLFNGGFLLDKAKSMAESGDLQRYTDSKDGFTLLVPSSWTKVEKPGASVLFEEPEKRSNSIGVVVSHVRIKCLDDFGTPQFVADKLINAKKRKESTKKAEVVSVGERLGQGQGKVYEFEYKINSTKGGVKRVFSAVFVSSRKLYILNVVHSDSLENPLDSCTRVLLEQVLHSFDALPLT